MMRWTRTVVFASILGVAACSSTPVEEHHYSLLLDALSDSEVVVSTDTDATLVVTSIVLPEYLRSNNLAMQVGDNEVLPARRHFWAEPLDESIKTVLANDLDRLLPDIAVRSEPSTDTCSLSVQFDRFHVTDAARVVASGRYTLLSPDGRIDRNFDASRSLPIGGYVNAVGELRNSVGELAKEIVSEIDEAISCLPTDKAAEPSS